MNNRLTFARNRSAIAVAIALVILSPLAWRSLSPLSHAESDASISGFALDTSGRLLSDVATNLVANADDTDAKHASAPSVLAMPNFSDDGSFMLTGLEPGTTTIFVFADGYADLEQTVELTEGQSLEGLNLVLQTSNKIQGTVFDSSGNPASGVSITLLDPSKEQERVYFGPPDSPNTRSNANGQFVCDGVSNSPVILVIDDGDHAPTFMSVDPATKEAAQLKVTLRPGGNITGRFKSELYQTARVVAFTQFDVGGQEIVCARDAIVIVKHDRFEIAGVYPGETTLRLYTFDSVWKKKLADSQGITYSEIGAKSVTVVGGETLRCDFDKIDGNCVLEGRVILPEGGEKATVQVYKGERDVPEFIVETLVEADGRYRVPYIPAGTATVKLYFSVGLEAKRVSAGEVELTDGQVTQFDIDTNSLTVLDRKP